MPQCPLCNKATSLVFCSAEDVEYFTSAASFDFFECDSCSVLFIYPMPVERLAEIYPANYYSFTAKQNSFAFRMKDWLDGLFYKKILQKIPGNQLAVLDIGGGTGTLLNTLKKADSRVLQTQVVDIDSNAKTIAENNGHRYFCGTIESFETTQMFDVILLLNLIEHVADPKAVLDKAGSLLSPEGVIIIKTPNYQSLDARLFQKSYWGGLHCPRHWVIFSKKSFNSLAARVNLQVDLFTYTQGAPFWSFSMLHWLHRYGWIKADKKTPLIYNPLFTIISLVMAAFDFVRKPFAPLSQMFFVLRKTKQ